MTSSSHLVNGLRWLDLDFRWRGADRIRDVCLQGDEDAAAIGDALTQPVVQVRVLVDETGVESVNGDWHLGYSKECMTKPVISCAAVQVDEGRSERWNKACKKIISSETICLRRCETIRTV